MARGWSLPQLEERTGIDAGHWSRIERGVRPPTELIAAKCDEAFPNAGNGSGSTTATAAAGRLPASGRGPKNKTTPVAA